MQLITQQVTGGRIDKLILLNQKKEEEFASCSYLQSFIIIWRRNGEEGGGEFKQRITNEGEGHLDITLHVTHKRADIRIWIVVCDASPNMVAWLCRETKDINISHLFVVSNK